MPALRSWKSQQLQRLKEDSDRMFNQLCSEFGLPSVCQPLLDPELAVKESPDSVIVEAFMPGVEADALSIRIDDGYLVVSCEHSEACGTMAQKSLFESRFRLPCKVRTEEVEATLEEDVLRIVMPKCKRPEARRIPVVIKG